MELKKMLFEAFDRMTEQFRVDRMTEEKCSIASISQRKLLIVRNC